MSPKDPELKGEPAEPAPVRQKRSPAKRLVIRLLLVGLVAFVVLAAIVVVRTLRFESKQPTAEKANVKLPDPAEMAERLAAGIRIQTISGEGTEADSQSFLDLHEHLRTSSPLAHEALVRETVADTSLLYTWSGTNPELPALILAAHLDVVPADPTRWSHPPFAGVVEDGFVYGRGALDDKVNVYGILEAVEQLLRDGFVPERSIYLAFGHDEEIGGYQGAQAIAALLKERKVHAEATIDEGLFITEGILEGMSRPVALIGIAEKGFLNLELVAQGEGGHSSMPPKETAAGVLSQAILNLQDNPMPGSMGETVSLMFEYVGPEFGFGRKLVMANLWLFGGLVEGALAKKPATDALLRTTTAPTMLEGSPKSNVLAQEARAVVNFRIKPGDSVNDVVEHVNDVVDDERVAVRILQGVEPQGASSIETRVFELLQQNIRNLDPESVVAPGLMIALTDSRHYSELTDDIYRFSALRMGQEDLKRLHGVDERIAIANYAEVVTFYVLFIRAAGL